MKRIAKFEKISLNQFKSDYRKEDTLEIYNDIKLPKRATLGSAGYDLFSPVDFSLKSGESIKIPTGIRVQIDTGWVLKCYPRSGLGFKYRVQLDNTVGIIDSDYYDSDNEGHIMIKLTNDSKYDSIVNIKKGDGIAQGIFSEYGITVDDNTTEIRNGGFGSTTTKEFSDIIKVTGDIRMTLISDTEKVIEYREYTAKRAYAEEYVVGKLVLDKTTNEILGILNKANDYSELAYIEVNTIKVIR